MSDLGTGAADAPLPKSLVKSRTAVAKWAAPSNVGNQVSVTTSWTDLSWTGTSPSAAQITVNLSSRNVFGWIFVSYWAYATVYANAADGKIINFGMKVSGPGGYTLGPDIWGRACANTNEHLSATGTQFMTLQGGSGSYTFQLVAKTSTGTPVWDWNDNAALMIWEP